MSDIHPDDQGKPGFAKAYGIVTAVLFLFSWIGQLVTQVGARPWGC